jgi:hypothetical protein
MRSGASTRTSVAARSPTLTAASAVKPWPEMTTAVSAQRGPAGGSTARTSGAASYS